MSEQWKPVPGYEGLYEVSSEGRIRSLARRVRHPRKGTRLINGQIMVNGSTRAGYATIILGKGGAKRSFTVHRLMARAFLGEPPFPEAQVRHLDGTKDNRVNNLAWGTVYENARDLVRHGGHHYAKRDCCKNGHEFTEENTYYPPTGGRACKECRRIRDRRRRPAKERVLKTHCKNGHEFTPENTRVVFRPHRGRACRACHRERARRERADRKLS